ncbi:hypothetical protein [Synechococcus sp. UW140]|uniref:hypothetical protein n=1 Tax=Synechococcus sp. UW140 TaxID=368503 RepID=UPI003138294C
MAALKQLHAMGVSRLAVLGALITTGVSANAVIPLVAQQEMTTMMNSALNYQFFLNNVTLISLPFLIGSLVLLRNKRNQQIGQIGFAVLAFLNMLLYLTNLQWHPLLIRCLIGVAFGLTIPIGQFSLAVAELNPSERVKQFTMMLNLVAAGLAVVPFIGIAILWFGNGNASLLFLFLAVLSAVLSILSGLWIPPRERICPPSRQSLLISKKDFLMVIGDAAVIILTRSIYAFVLVWLSSIISNFKSLQMISLCFTLPFVVWGFLAIPLLKLLKPMISFGIFVISPAVLLGFIIGIRDLYWLPFALVFIALLSIPEAFTPGQLISQWQTASGRQFGNILTMALMTVCLAIGPAIFELITYLSHTWPIISPNSPFNMSLWLLLLPLPIALSFIVGFWRKHLIPSLRRS